ncbi:hypothetical protein KIPB_006100 [Kipferlia bialata]|uniref:Uncharacterized protein n=1 Tax=Kipferlia bialata TaxID=797122 RepID=A0A9K3CYD7_9EUKA|nr:hypothetical protein KIPB_006100 [Kipferlia bialata]|eukprot:g6100.t1
MDEWFSHIFPLGSVPVSLPPLCTAASLLHLVCRHVMLPVNPPRDTCHLLLTGWHQLLLSLGSADPADIRTLVPGLYSHTDTSVRLGTLSIADCVHSAPMLGTTLSSWVSQGVVRQAALLRVVLRAQPPIEPRTLTLPLLRPAYQSYQHWKPLLTSDAEDTPAPTKKGDKNAPPVEEAPGPAFPHPLLPPLALAMPLATAQTLRETARETLRTARRERRERHRARRARHQERREREAEAAAVLAKETAPMPDGWVERETAAMDAEGDRAEQIRQTETEAANHKALTGDVSQWLGMVGIQQTRREMLALLDTIQTETGGDAEQ